jgi:hypothetical protein
MPIITVELSVDGQVWSALQPQDFTSKSLVSLLVQEPPIVTRVSPLKFLRAPSYSVIFTGSNIDLLTGCSGVLTVYNHTTANCTLAVSPHETNHTVQASSSLHLFDLGYIQIIDFTRQTMLLPRFLTSYIITDVPLDLPKQNNRFLITP